MAQSAFLKTAFNSTSRHRAESPNRNTQLEDDTRNQHDRIVAYRVTTDEVLCRNFTQDVDITIPRSNFSSRYDYESITPGCQVIQQHEFRNATPRNDGFVPSRVAAAVFEGFGRVASISKSAIIFTANGHRFRADSWAFPIDNNNSKLNIGNEIHFEALPPNKNNTSDRSKKQASLPMIFGAHIRRDDCSTVLRHHPAHWSSHI